MTQEARALVGTTFSSRHFEHHDLTPGGEVTYFMTGPEEDQHHGWWRITLVDPPRSLELIDGFADEQGNPNEALPTTTMTMTISAGNDGTRMELRSAFNAREQMEELVSMGMEEGIRGAVNQIDAILAG